MKGALQAMGAGVPALYKQYVEVAEPGGVSFKAFGVDTAFGYCIDGLVVVDVARLKADKRRRYIGEDAVSSGEEALTKDEHAVLERPL